MRPLHNFLVFVVGWSLDLNFLGPPSREPVFTTSPTCLLKWLKNQAHFMKKFLIPRCGLCDNLKRRLLQFSRKELFG